MTEFEACKKYFSEYKALAESGILLELDEKLNVIHCQLICDRSVLGKKMFALLNARKNYVQIYNFDGIQTFQFMGETTEIELDPETGRICDFEVRRKTPVDLKLVAKDLEKMQSGIPLLRDEDRYKYSS